MKGHKKGTFDEVPVKIFCSMKLSDFKRRSLAPCFYCVH